MTAEEILAKLAESEGLYMEVGDWAISFFDDNPEAPWHAVEYRDCRAITEGEQFPTFREALEYALK